MIITTVMVVILIIWCTITVLRSVPVQLPPNPLHPGVVPLNKESLGWLQRNLVQPFDVDHPVRRLRALGAGHERRRNAGPGQPRNRTSQAEESGKDRAGDFRLQPAVHFAGFVLCGDDHSGQGPPGIFRQPDRRHRHVSGGADQREAAVPRIRRAGGRADSGGGAEYFDRGRERRVEPRGRRRRADQLVSEAASPLRHQLSHHQPDCLHAVADHRFSAVAMSTCWPRCTPSA